MQVNIKGTGIELTQDIYGYINKKLSAIEKHLGSLSETALIDVEVGKTTEHHKSGNIFRAELHVMGDNLDIYADAEQSDLFAAIDIVKDEVLHALEQKKGKQEALYRRGARAAKDMMRGLTDRFRRR